MNDLVIMKNQQAVTSSLQVAKTFEKNHRDVLKAIDELKKGVAQNFADLFYKDKYKHPQNNQEYRMYYMNRDGFTLLAMGFTGKRATQFKIQYINAFNQMEKQVKNGGFNIPSTMSEALRLAADQQEKIEELSSQKLRVEQQVTKLKPKATYYDQVLKNPSLVTITIIAKDYGMSGIEMNKLLHKLKIQYNQGDIWLLYAKYQSNGWTQSETRMVRRNNGTRKVVMNTKWTQKGRLGLYKELKRYDILPMIEQDLEV